MKHGISPTTNRRESRDRGTIAHLSKALVFRVIDPNKKGEVDGRVEIQYLPLHISPPEGCLAIVVVAPDKGVTYRCRVKEDESIGVKRPGLRRRYALSGRELHEERFARRERPCFVDFSWL